MSRIRRNLYFIEKYIVQDHQHCRVKNDDNTLFSGNQKTKILAQDLPEWFVYGRFYKRFGYMSTKGITDLLYVPSKVSNHFLKDDCLLIAYGGKMENVLPENERQLITERYIGFNETVWGNEILDIIKGARVYSSYDIASLIELVKAKKEWLKNRYPDEFGSEGSTFDVDAFFSAPFYNRRGKENDNESE